MHRRDLIRFGAASLAATWTPAPSHAATAAPPETRETQDAQETQETPKIEQWGLFELVLNGPPHGNPFTEVTFNAVFTQGHRTRHVTGFYDGEGIYRLRYMPDMTGLWNYQTSSSAPELDHHAGLFRCVAPRAGNHGPVGVAHQFHFQYADGTPYFPFGTTTYAYLFTSDNNARASLEGMKQCRFNKSRVCVMPKPLDHGPELLPFAPSAPPAGSDAKAKASAYDLTRFNPAFFQLLERRILQLQQAGIEADCILFHPYDGWGFKAMGAEADDFYLRYVIARLSAYRNVWWAIANEYDLVKSKTTADWDRLFRITQAEDPYAHLRSIHHSRVIYDHSRPWCTHASLQSFDFERSAERRAAWNKPILYDEVQYEGDTDRRWGNLAAQEMTRRFWLALVHGAYASHGEVFLSDTGEPSWSDAGPLRGESGARIAFLRALVERVTRTGLQEFEGAYYLNAGTPGELYLYYLDYHRPARYDFPLPATANFQATLIDPDAMTATPLPGTFSGKSRVKLTGRPCQAVLFQKVSANNSHAPAPAEEPKVPENEPG